MSILHTAVLGVILIVFSSVLYFISVNFYKKLDQNLLVKARIIDSTIKTYLNVLNPQDADALSKAVHKTLSMKNEGFMGTKIKKVSEDWVKEAQGFNLNKDYIHFFSRDKKEDISSDNLDKELRSFFMEDIRFPKGAKFLFKSLKYNHKIIRVITYPLDEKPSGEYFVQVGVSQDPIMQQFKNWFYSFLVSLPLILFLTSIMGRKQAARILQPVHAITDMANKITHQDLSTRIKTTHFDSDMRSLIEAFNDMIARLEKSFNHIEEFSHHVAHELKTPLTIIKGEADLLLRKDRSKHEYQQTLRIILEESERVLKTIDDLLLLAKLDYQPEVFKFEEFDFIEFLTEICEQGRILAANKTISITMRMQDIKSPLMVKADRLHLRRLFFNILDNAIKFTPKLGRIDIRITELPDNKLRVAVMDTGPGISEENLKRIFEKFFNSGAVGNGLGLNIAWTIAKLHHGDILVESKVGEGSSFIVILPSL